MVLDVACCGALLYPRAKSWNVETCGPGDSAPVTKDSWGNAIISATIHIDL